jgi:hypothetical protein
MPLLIAVLLFTWMISKAVGNSVVDNNLAKQGIVSPRMQSRHGGDAPGKVAKYGFTDHLKDNWSDMWSRRTEAMVAARDAKANPVDKAAHPDGTVDPTAKVGWRDRWAAAKGVMSRAGTDTAGAINRVSAEHPVPASRDSEVGATPVAPEADAPATGPTPTPPTSPAPAIGRASVPATNPDAPIETATVHDTTVLPKMSKESAMSVPVGEAVNYETTVQVLEDLIKELGNQVDAAHGAQTAMSSAKASIDAMQATYRGSADTAAMKLDYETSLNLDGTTIGHAGTTVDSMDPNAVDNLFDAAEAMEVDIAGRLQQSETALASAEAELEHIRRTYGDAHETVAGNLSGDSRFLDAGGGHSGGGSGGGTTPSPSVPAGGELETVGAHRAA